MSFRDNRDQGRKAVEKVARKWNLVQDMDSAEWYDARNRRTGARYEVKSTHVGGRFRLWKDQLKSLVGYQARNAAWVAFVVFDGSGNAQRIVRKRPDTVARIVTEHGGWNRAGHTDRRTKQKKLPESAIR